MKTVPIDKVQHYSMVLETRKRLLTVSRANSSNKTVDKNGASTDLLALSLRFIGITEFFLAKNIESFRQNLAESAKLRLSLFQRFDSGEGVDPSFVAMVSYKKLYDGLAAGDFLISTQLAQLMGGRADIEKKHDHPFDRVMGYALREVVLDIKNGSGRSELREKLARNENRDFKGYAMAFDGIDAGNNQMFNEGLNLIIEGHLRQSRTGVFKASADELLCIWGVGVANLAIKRGLEVKVDHELIPVALLQR
jgi:hypothetical protein